MAFKAKVLLVAPGADRLELKGGKTAPTGYYLNELTVPAMALIEKGFEVVVATPGGKRPTMDPRSEKVTYFGKDPERLHRALHFANTHSTMKKPLILAEVAEKDPGWFDGLFIPGGHAPMADLMQDASLGKILRLFHEKEKITAALCHGPAALLSALEKPAEYKKALAEGDLERAKKLSGEWIYAGYRMTVYSTEAEVSVEKNVFSGQLPFYAADALRIAGGIVENGPPKEPFVVRDRELVTGQDPASDCDLVEAFMDALGGY